MQNTGIEIRLATRVDLPAVIEVAILAYETFAPLNTREDLDIFYRDYYTLSKLEEELSQPETALYLVLSSGEVLGFAQLRKSSEVRETLGDSTVELQRLYIHPRHQGKGLGSMLMETALRYTESKGAAWLWLGVWEKNVKAQAFYTKWGFERFGEHIFVVGHDPQLDWLLKRKV